MIKHFVLSKLADLLDSPKTGSCRLVRKVSGRPSPHLVEERTPAAQMPIALTLA